MSGIGLPDWYDIKKAGAVSALGDLGELAARLGSIVTFDRRGDVLWLTSFECGLASVETATSGAGGAVVLSTASARNGGYSAKLTAGSDGGKYAQVLKRVHPTVVGKVGVEFSWARRPADTIITVFLAYFPSGAYHYGGLRYHGPDDVWQYLDKANVWQTLEADVDLFSGDAVYHTMKLVIDLETDEYVRAMLDGFEHSLEGVGMLGSFIQAGPYVLALVDLTDILATNPYIYVDDLIITQNES